VTELLAAMASQQVALDARGFAAAAHALAADGHWRPARQLFRDMQWSVSAGGGSDVRAFTAVLRAYERAGGHGRAALTFLKQGPTLFGVQPNARSYRACLQACAQVPLAPHSSSRRSDGAMAADAAASASLAADALAAWAARPNGVEADAPIAAALLTLQARVGSQ
jgi:hypothetical protein